MKILAAVVICLLTVNISYARIGETMVQVEKRLGSGSEGTPNFPSPTGHGVEWRMYLKGDYEIRIVFYKGISQHEEYTRMDAFLDISPEMISSILSNNSAGEQWVKEPSVKSPVDARKRPYSDDSFFVTKVRMARSNPSGYGGLDPQSQPDQFWHTVGGKNPLVAEYKYCFEFRGRNRGRRLCIQTKVCKAAAETKPKPTTAGDL